VDGADESGWSAVADEWAELWGGFAAPAQRVVVAETGIRPGSRVLDVGCGSGEFLQLLADLGAQPTGLDPAPGMVRVARARVPGVDIRLGFVEELPWPGGAFEVVTAFNALQFAVDTLAALAEMRRVVVPGGSVAVANWAEDSRNDLTVVEAAVALAHGEELPVGGTLRDTGGLEAVLASAGLTLVSSGLVEMTWDAPDDAALVRGVLLGEGSARMAELADTVVRAARPFRRGSGTGYTLTNAFRWAVGR
jgi:SAM-dependent methyltransferase